MRLSTTHPPTFPAVRPMAVRPTFEGPLMRLVPARLLPVVVLLATATASPAADPPAFSAEQVAFYEKQVHPVLKAHCLKCHGEDPKKVRGGLDLTRRAGVLTGGDTGPAVDLKQPDASLLLKAIHYKDEDYRMPPAGKLPAEPIAVLTKWVKDGLPWTPGERRRHPGGEARRRPGQELLGLPARPAAGREPRPPRSGLGEDARSTPSSWRSWRRRD